jgi:hypothetical protein
MTTKLKDYLLLVAKGLRPPTHLWAEQAREAFSSHLVTVGWGGRLKLTPGGEHALTLPINEDHNP